MRLREALSTSSGDCLRLVFAHETGDVCKTLSLGPRRNLSPKQLRWAIEKRAIEAERDIAAKVFGDEWAGHVTRAGTPQRESLVRSVIKQFEALLPLGRTWQTE